MGGLFGPPQLPAIPIPPSAPSMSDPAIVAAHADEKKQRAQARGRASTFLMSPQARSAEANRQRSLSGA